MATRTGQMRHRVQLQAYATTRDEEGGTIRTFTTVAELWARVEPIGGKEREQGRQQKSVKTHQITMRFYDGFATAGTDETMRLLFTKSGVTHIFNIVAVVDPGFRGINTILDVQSAGVLV